VNVDLLLTFWWQASNRVVVVVVLDLVEIKIVSALWTGSMHDERVACREDAGASSAVVEQPERTQRATNGAKQLVPDEKQAEPHDRNKDQGPITDRESRERDDAERDQGHQDHAGDNRHEIGSSHSHSHEPPVLRRGV
jgi:hypothetical protein